MHAVVIAAKPQRCRRPVLSNELSAMCEFARGERWPFALKDSNLSRHRGKRLRLFTVNAYDICSEKFLILFVCPQGNDDP